MKRNGTGRAVTAPRVSQVPARTVPAHHPVDPRVGVPYDRAVQERVRCLSCPIIARPQEGLRRAVHPRIAAPPISQSPGSGGAERATTPSTEHTYSIRHPGWIRYITS